MSDVHDTPNPGPGDLFHPALLDDEALVHLRRVALGPVLQRCGRLAQWLFEWCGTEQAARARGDDTRTARHMTGVPVLDGWSNSEIAAGLRTVIVWNYLPSPELEAQWVARLVFAFSETAAERLEGRAHA